MTFLKNSILAVVLGLSAVVKAANDDVFACCSTRGPDRYADGSPVADGESYALVYTKAGAVFAGFQVDGGLVDSGASEVVLVLPMAKGGRCHPTLCVLPKTFATKRKTGTWELVLLDTRRANGEPAGVDADGCLRRVNSWGHTASYVDFQVGGFSLQAAAPLVESGTAGCEAVASQLSVLPAGLTPPRITGMSLEGGVVKLKVAETRPYLTYDVKGSDRLDAVPARRVGERTDGVSAGEIEIRADGTAARFFKVVVDR